ncbi:hypothetical protein [Autumnicola musiva]|uniref:Uncharacterized protein n=1 Tax=Autumnicola musiva TaxID=3075589 RepID=A0ABU3D566_9FLAO|nr:hypothetical protein [Zunongwangia sp. F117]MDT0676675.1 hypothetical protein [Zunongwangia sp. F117]
MNTQKPGDPGERIIEDVVIIGVTSNPSAANYFENQLKGALLKRGIHAIPASDSLNYSFPNSRKAEEKLAEQREKLLEEGYNTVLISKIEDVETKPDFFQFLGNLWNKKDEFKEDSGVNEAPAPSEEASDRNKIYHSDTEVFVLNSTGKKLIWECSLELKNPRKVKSSIRKFNTRLIEAMEKDKLFSAND